VGTQAPTQKLGNADDFNTNQAAHILLPKALQSIQSTRRRVGLGNLADQEELKLNRGAEAPMPQAKARVLKAINSITLDDAKAIYDDPSGAATQYVRRVPSNDLTKTVTPVIEKHVKTFVPDLKADLTSSATKLALDGLRHY